MAVYVVTSADVASTAFRPALAALFSSTWTPDELTASNAMSSTIESVSSFAGPAIGGVVVATAGADMAFVITALTLLWSAILLLGVQEPARESS